MGAYTLERGERHTVSVMASLSGCTRRLPTPRLWLPKCGSCPNARSRFVGPRATPLSCSRRSNDQGNTAHAAGRGSAGNPSPLSFVCRRQAAGGRLRFADVPPSQPGVPVALERPGPPPEDGKGVGRRRLRAQLPPQRVRTELLERIDRSRVASGGQRKGASRGESSGGISISYGGLLDLGKQ